MWWRGGVDVCRCVDHGVDKVGRVMKARWSEGWSEGTVMKGGGGEGGVQG